MNDDLGNRMKGYEAATVVLLPRRTFTVIRVDGKAFHTFTRHCVKPWDQQLQQAMQNTMLELCKELQGAAFGYQQSDEISILLTDFSTAQTQAAYNGSLQKLCSISASIATAEFSSAYRTSVPAITLPPAASEIDRKAAAKLIKEIADGNVTGIVLPSDAKFEWHRSSAEPALFDARVFTIPDPVEVENYFVWRQKDCERNSISALARKYYSDRELKEKSRTEQHDMIHAAEDNWNNWPNEFKRGVVSTRYSSWSWGTDAAHIFTSEEGRKWLKAHIPERGY